jgi:ZIP family zinc transporter
MQSHFLLPLALGLGASLATLFGGTLALRLGSAISMILGLTAGAVIGVALFDLVPEALEVAGDSYAARTILVAVASGLAGYMILDRLLTLVGLGERGHAHLGAGSLTVHSLLDGLGIGFAFQVSTNVGLVVAGAVLAHDLSDGVNTVSLSLGLAGAGGRNAARSWLIADALAPLVGVLISFAVKLPNQALAPLLGVFAGAFLYIGVAQLAPRSYGLHPRIWTTAATILGMALIYLAVTLAG